MVPRVCNIYNIPAHYRKCIYNILDKEFECSFVFGDENLNVKTFDISVLKQAKVTHVSHIGDIVFQIGIIPYIFRKFDYYILTGATNDLTHWLFLFIAKLFPKKKVFIWTHGIYGYESKKQLIVRKIFYRLCDGIFLYGQFARDNMVELRLYPNNKMFVLHNSLNYSEQLKIREQLKKTSVFLDHFGNDKPILIFIGRLTKVKKLGEAIEALGLLRGCGEEYNMVFIGDGDEKDALIKKCNELSLQKSVWFYGACYDEMQNAQLIYNSDLCISPGNVGLTALHCMMFGTPVLTHDNLQLQMPEFETIKDGETGCFFKENDPIDLAKRISEWFNNNQYDRENIRKACFNVIDNDWNPNYQLKVFKEAFNV